VVRAHKGAPFGRRLTAVPRNAKRVIRVALALGIAVALGAASKAPPGVTPSEIVVGTHVDLSGPLSQEGTAVRNGLITAFDEVNAAGGVNGRKLRLIVADNDYSPKKAMAVVKTFIERDHVLAVLCPVGTPPVAKTMPLVLNSGTLHLFPFTPAADTYVPMQPLEFVIDLPVVEQIAVGLHAILAGRGSLKVGVLYGDDALGAAALNGAVNELAAHNTRPVAIASYRPGDLNFTAALANLRGAGAEIVVLGGVPQDAIFAMQQAAAADWFPTFLCGSACYVPELPMLGGRAVSGLYAVATTPIPYPDDKDPKLRAWVRRYEQRFGTVASQQAFRAYLDARLFVEALRRAGSNVTPRRVARALEVITPWRDPVYGGVPVVFAPRNHVGLRTGFLAQVRNGRWTTLTGTLTSGLRQR
jgi:branched-chain amino acid transport system substrate-binding protein